MKVVPIGETVVFRSLRSLLELCRTPRQSQQLRLWLLQHAEIEGDNLISIEVLRESQRKWLIVYVCTEDNSYNLEDENIYLTSDWFNTKALLNAKPTKWYNSLLGEQVEFRVSESIA